MLYRIEIHESVTIDEECTEYKKLHDKEKFDSKLDPQYGYVKSVQKKTQDKKIYEQTTNKEIHLKAIIDAFNN